MDILRKDVRSFREKIIYALLLSTVCIAINICLGFLADYLSLPLYLDSIGTVIAAMLGGFVPGVLVGMISSFLSTLSDPIAISYTLLNVLIAVATVIFRDHGFFKDIKKTLIALFIYSAIGGILGKFLTWTIYGFDIEEISVGVKRFLLDTGLFGSITADIVSNFLIDMVDKAIDVILLVIIERTVPYEIRDRFDFKTWHQAPLSDDAIAVLNKNSRGIKSLKFKTILLLGFASFLTAAAAIIISLILYQTSTVKQHGEYATNIANTAALVVDGDRIDSFIVKGENAYMYAETKELLGKVIYNSQYLEYLYVYKFNEKDGWHVIFDFDNNGVKGGEVGEAVPIEPALLPYKDRIRRGEEIGYIITNDEYGWLLTALVPIRDSKDVTVAYAAADINMEPILNYGIKFFASQISIFFGVFIFIFVLGLTFANYQIILPLNAMAYTATEYIDDQDGALEKVAEGMKNLDISTGDEIENLYRAFYKMTRSNLQHVEDISEMQDALIRVLADMVESRDHNTGDHVMKTAEYVKIILDEMRKEGIYSDELTDEFVRNVYLSTPLHDIGKISISDMILNKPGRLSPEEFEIMKTHARAGADIIQRVIETIPGTDKRYLREAKNLALYHHEKWNGEGYPTGLRGEEIPLSARIMAVADVFDALVSERSYKKPFSYEKAIQIITESSGSHFDPKIAGAFLNAQDEVRRVVNKKNN